MPTTLDTYAPFDLGAGSAVTEVTWRKFMRHSMTNGVIAAVNDEFEVFADSTGLQVKVRTGECWIEGHWGESTSQKTLGIATADATNPRTDRVILRADFVDNVIELDVLTGTPAGSPTTPALTQNTSVWEISLALVSVPALDTSIDAAQVTIDRVLSASGGQFITMIKSPDQSLTSTTTMTDVTGLAAPVVADGVYFWELWLIYRCGSATDMKFTFTSPSGSSGKMSVQAPDALVMAGTDSRQFPDYNARSGLISATWVVPGDLSATQEIEVRAEGYLAVGTTSGTFQLQFAQQTSSATACAIAAGTRLRMHRVS